MSRSYGALIATMSNSSEPLYKVVTELVLENITTVTKEWSSTTELALANDIVVTVVITIILSLLTLGCIIGNSLVIIAVWHVHKLKTPSNYLIVSLAVSDWFVGMLVMPLAIVYEILHRWPLEQTACIVWVTSDVTLCTSSILNLMMISIDRYLIITMPFKYSQYRTVKLMVLYISLAWFISLAISTLPLMIGWLPEQGPDGNTCQVSQKLGYQIYATFGAFYLPMLVMVGLYGRIYFISQKVLRAEAKNNPRPMFSNNDETRLSNSSEVSSDRIPPMNGVKKDVVDTVPEHTVTVSSTLHLPLDHNLVDQTILEDRHQPSDSEHDWLKKNDNHTNDHNHLQHPHHHHLFGHHGHGIKRFSVATIASIKKLLTRRTHQRNSHAIKTLGVIMGLFTFCWLPFFVLAVVAPICGESCNIPKWVWGSLTWLGYANSCFNPIIYASFNREFRLPFREILCCRCHKINESVRHTDYLYQYGT